MATLKRCHTPLPWGVQVEPMVWERSRSGKPRRKRSNKPALAYDPGWDWGTERILFGDTMFIPEAEESSTAQGKLQEDAQMSSGRPRATLSLLDVARYEATRRRKAKSGFSDFEVIRVPKVVPVTEEEFDLWDTWELSEWEKLDALGLKKSYSEVTRGLPVDEGENHANMPDCSRLVPRYCEDDSWEYL